MGAAFGKESYEDCEKKCQRKKRNDFVVVESNQQEQSRTQPQPSTPYNPSKQKLPQARQVTTRYSSAGLSSLGGGGRKKKINRKSSKKRKLKKNKKKSLKRKK